MAASVSTSGGEHIFARSDQDAQRISRVIFDYAAKIAGEQDTDGLLRLNAGMARDLLGADRCTIWLVDSTSRELWTKVAHGMDEIRIPIDQGLVGACVSNNQPILVAEAHSDSRFNIQVDHASGYNTHSVLCIPLHSAEGKVIGAFQALNKPGGFTEDDAHLLQLAASYSASALEAQRLRKVAESARILYRELGIARDVQEKLLPVHPPMVEGLDCAAYCRPAKFVGGDYYDFVESCGESMAFTLGDVSGKGIAAAVLMASIQASLRAQFVNAPDSLSGMMNNYNKALFATSTSDKYSTLFCGLIHREARTLTYVNAGQSPPLLLCRGDSGGVNVKHLNVGGYPVGLMGAASYEDATIPLRSGDVLVCFSDGLSEATNGKDEMWTEDVLVKLLLELYDENPQATAEQIIQHFVKAADEFTGEAEQADDMTMVVIRVL
jgi:sigma-B regulation protein RsbU (phosphoserine phosphatase)